MTTTTKAPDPTDEVRRGAFTLSGIFALNAIIFWAMFADTPLHVFMVMAITWTIGAAGVAYSGARR